MRIAARRGRLEIKALRLQKGRGAERPKDLNQINPKQTAPKSSQGGMELHARGREVRAATLQVTLWPPPLPEKEKR
jgi:hypothetical protein